MKVVSVWNRKGGVGKTTLTFNLSANLAQRGKKVLCIDFDSQSNLSSFFEERNKKSPKKYNISELAQKSFVGLEKSIYKSKYKQIDYIQGSNECITHLSSMSLLLEALKQIETKYDYCFIDCRPDFSDTIKNALFASDLIVVPIALDGFSRNNLNIVRNHIYEVENMIDEYTGQAGHDLPYCVVANRVLNRRAQKEVYKDIIKKHDYPLLELCISEREAVHSSGVMQKPLYAHRSKDEANLDLQELTDYIDKMLNEGVV